MLRRLASPEVWAEEEHACNDNDGESEPQDVPGSSTGHLTRRAHLVYLLLHIKILKKDIENVSQWKIIRLCTVACGYMHIKNGSQNSLAEQKPTFSASTNADSASKGYKTAKQ